MPIYEWKCPKCGEVDHKMTFHMLDEIERRCPKCRALMSYNYGSTFQLRGDGWYRTPPKEEKNAKSDV